jgi:hypothetical protein
MKSKSSKKPRLRVQKERQRKLKALIAKQGVSRTANFEHLLGSAGDLWEDEHAFKKFLDTVKAVRQEKG